MVAIVSLGEARPLLLRPAPPASAADGPGLRYSLGHGDLIVMGGSCQRTWEHAIPKSARPAGPADQRPVPSPGRPLTGVPVRLVGVGEYPSLVATDLDGTIIRGDGTISARTVAAFARVEAAGARFVLVTGRPPRWMAVDRGHLRAPGDGHLRQRGARLRHAHRDDRGAAPHPAAGARRRRRGAAGGRARHRDRGRVPGRARRRPALPGGQLGRELVHAAPRRRRAVRPAGLQAARQALRLQLRRPARAGPSRRSTAWSASPIPTARG